MRSFNAADQHSGRRTVTIGDRTIKYLSATGYGCNHGRDIFKTSFVSIFRNHMARVVDAIFGREGWQLQAWGCGCFTSYQVYFGEGVGVDNHYEYGFSYLYDTEELCGWMESFYRFKVERDYNYDLNERSK